MAVSQTLTLTQTYQNIEAGYSDVLVVWKSTQTGSSYNNYTRKALYWLSLNGGDEVLCECNYTLPKNSTTTILSTTIRVYHLEDGTGSLKVRTWMDTNISAGVINLNKTLTLTTIPRKALLSVSNGTLGVAQTLNIQKRLAGVLVTIKYTVNNLSLPYGNASGTVCTKTTASNVEWTPPLDLAAASPQGTQVTVKFTVETYSAAGNLIGTSSTGAITYDIPATVFPPVIFETTDLTSNYATYGAFVQGKSKLNIAISTYGVYGSWITSVRTDVEGKTYTDKENVQTDVISTSGVLPIRVTVTDSRNRMIVDNGAVDVLPYEAPKITAVTVQRCNQDGTLNNDGSYMRVKFSASVSALNNNNHATYYVGYKKATEANHTAVELTSLKNKYNVTDATYVVPADPAYSHTIIVTVLDDFDQDRKTLNGMSVKKAWSMLKKNGEVVGMAFGKLAEHENCFDIGWPVKFSGGGDCVVDQGTKDGWTYRKWDSGIAECWTIHTYATTIATSFGSLYCGNAMARLSYPFTFTDKPVEIVTLQSGSTQAFLYAETNPHGVNGAASSARYNVFSPVSKADSQTFYLSFHVIGKWK